MALSTNLTDYVTSFSILFTLSLLLLISKRRKNKHEAYNLPPGPPKLPIIGNLHQLGKPPQQSFYHLAQKYGPLLYLKLGDKPTIVVSSAEAAKAVLKTHDLDSCSRANSTTGKKVSYDNADMVFGVYGEQWRVLRKSCIVEFFSTKKLQMFHWIREQEVELMVGSIASRSGDVINVSEEMLTLANHITSRSALGRRYYNKESGEGSRLPEMIKDMQAVLGTMFFADYVPMLGWLIDRFTGMRARLDRTFKEFDDFYQLVIDEHMSKRGVKREEEDTLDGLLRIQRETGCITTEQVKGALLDIFVGGSDTSSATVEWTMTELMRNPTAMEKAQAEVRRVIGSKGKVEESDLPQLNYMKCVLKESLRLHPPAPLLVPRETMRHFKINGFDIPANTRLIVNAWAIGREEASWENPLEFKPERFIDTDIDLKGHDFQLIPFGAGRRICPGMHIGMAVVELALANLLYSFDWHMPEGMSKEDINMGEAPGITVHREINLQLVATKYIV